MANKKKHIESSSVRQKAHDGVDKIMDKADSMEEDGREKFDRLKEKANMVKESVDEYIRENPEKSVLIAAGIGAIIGGILAATMMRKR